MKDLKEKTLSLNKKSMDYRMKSIGLINKLLNSNQESADQKMIHRTVHMNGKSNMKNHKLLYANSDLKQNKLPYKLIKQTLEVNGKLNMKDLTSNIKDFLKNSKDIRESIKYCKKSLLIMKES